MDIGGRAGALLRAAGSPLGRMGAYFISTAPITGGLNNFATS
jgi:hypothetical protein